LRRSWRRRGCEQGAERRNREAHGAWRTQGSVGLQFDRTSVRERCRGRRRLARRPRVTTPVRSPRAAGGTKVGPTGTVTSPSRRPTSPVTSQADGLVPRLRASDPVRGADHAPRWRRPV